MSNHHEANEFRALRLRDVLEARALYHNHLVGIDGEIVGTAVGLKRYASRRGQPKTFENTLLREDSYPCLYVLVRRWRPAEEFHGDPAALGRFIPPVLHLPDGRRVPTCVLLVTSQERAAPLGCEGFRSPMIGGGYPIFSIEQGRKHHGTLACLVTDGSATYGLTCRHVAGEPGRPVYANLATGARRIGEAHTSVGKELFQQAYPDWNEPHVYLNVDAGLVRLDQLTQATAQVLGVRHMGTLLNLAPETLSLDLIGQPVHGFGGVAGVTEGRIDALFFRYRAVGGFEYVADVMIGPRPDAARGLHGAPGNSGELWFIDRDGAPRPLAMQWGGHEERDGGRPPDQYVLGTFLSTIARALDVDVVRNWNSGLFEFWGAATHQALSALLPRCVAQGQLAHFLGSHAATLRALAPVPDNWLRPRVRAGAEPSYFFTDLDEPAAQGRFAGRSLLDLWADRSLITRKVFREYVDGLAPQNGRRGAPPPRTTLAFRAAAIYEELVKFLRAGRPAEFMAGVGVLAQYVEDACCSLQLSGWHHGDPRSRNEKEHGIHEAYEQARGEKLDALMEQVARRLGSWRPDAADLTPTAVAHRVVALQRQVYAELDPKDLVRAYVAGSYQLPWSKLEGPTVEALTQGLKLLADVVESAWRVGNGKAIPEAALERVGDEEITEIVSRPEFLPSALDFDPGGGEAASREASARGPEPRRQPATNGHRRGAGRRPPHAHGRRRPSAGA